MKRHSIEARREQLLRCIPDITSYISLLYVGANVRRMEMLDLFIERHCRVDIMEVWPENVAGLEEWNRENKSVHKIIEGDVRELSAENKYDLVMWWHGPEHVKKDELPNTLQRLERAARRIVVTASPSGVYQQGEAHENPFERHCSAIYARDLREFGYRINILGKTDRPGSNLLGWKRLHK